MTRAVSLCPLSLPSSLSGKNALYPFEISGKKRGIGHSFLGTVYLLSHPAEALFYPIETRKLTLASRPRCTEN